VSNGTYKKIFAPNDGMLLDVAVSDTSLNDWQILLDYLFSHVYLRLFGEWLCSPVAEGRSSFRKKK
jgi:hypothetical protein